MDNSCCHKSTHASSAMDRGFNALNVTQIMSDATTEVLQPVSLDAYDIVPTLTTTVLGPPFRGLNTLFMNIPNTDYASKKFSR